MQTLTDQQLFESLTKTRNLTENEGKLVVNEFRTEQPALAHTLFNIFPTIIAEKNEEMAMMLMDVIFDVLCIYQFTFGKLPPQTEQWLQKQMEFITTQMNGDKEAAKASINELKTDKLAILMQESITDFANEQIEERQDTLEASQTTILSVIRLLNNAYDTSAAQ